MTFILGVIVGACAMWLRDWVRAKPVSPLLQLPAADLRNMIADLRQGYDAARRERTRLLGNGYPSLADDLAKRSHGVIAELAELHEALRIVEARETPDPRGPYR